MAPFYPNVDSITKGDDGHATQPIAHIGLPHALPLPAVRWKLLNLQKLKNDNPVKHAEQRGEIERLFTIK